MCDGEGVVLCVMVMGTNAGGTGVICEMVRRLVLCVGL